MKKVCVVGHFGFGHDLLNGQTIKTKIVADEIEKNVREKGLVRVDTHGGIKALLKLPFLLAYAVVFFKNVVFLPAYNGLRIIVPILVLYNIFFNRKLHYVVVGGWLPVFLQNKPFLRRCLKAVDCIYVETKSMKQTLNSLGFDNVLVLPNFKDLNILEENELPCVQCGAFKFCTFSRVMKEKGIEDAVTSIKNINQKYGREICSLDIYGQVDCNQKDWFDRLKNDFPSYIQYKGMVPFEKSVETLKEYYMLLFPTYYNGEGFAGTLIDAFAAGVPVIASDWHFNCEIVDDNENGFIVKARNVENLIEKIEWCIQNAETVADMKINCLKKAEALSPAKVINQLVSLLV